MIQLLLCKMNAILSFSVRQIGSLAADEHHTSIIHFEKSKACNEYERKVVFREE